MFLTHNLVNVSATTECPTFGLFHFNVLSAMSLSIGLVRAFIIKVISLRKALQFTEQIHKCMPWTTVRRAQLKIRVDKINFSSKYQYKNII